MKIKVYLPVLVTVILLLIACTNKGEHITYLYPTANSYMLKVEQGNRNINIYEISSFGKRCLFLKLYKKGSQYYRKNPMDKEELILSTEIEIDTVYQTPDFLETKHVIIKKCGHNLYSTSIYYKSNGLLFVRFDYDEHYRIKKICRFGYDIDYKAK